MNIRAKYFTMVELVIVMTIIAVILSLTLVSVNKIMSAQRLNTAVGKFENAVKQARNVAVANQSMVALLIPYLDEDQDFEKMGGFQCRGYRICEVTKDRNQYEFVRWMPNLNWEQLPEGVVIAGVRELTASDEDSYADVTGTYEEEEYKVSTVFGSGAVYDELEGVESYFNSRATGNWAELLVKNVPTEDQNRNTSYSTQDCSGVVFNKYGNALNVSPMTLVLAEGRVQARDNDGRPYFKFGKTYKNIDGDNCVANWAELRIEVFSGMPQVRYQYQKWGVEE